MNQRFVPEETIAIDDDEEFLSLADATAVTLTLSASTTHVAQTLTKRFKPFSPPKLEGAYVDALRGADVLPPSSWNAGARALVTGCGGGSGDVCLKCGKVGHWSCDCDSAEMAAGGGGAAEVVTKQCLCRAGDCLVLTANTERNRGMEVLQVSCSSGLHVAVAVILNPENGGCNFFEWCDGVNATASRGNTNTGYDNNSFSSQFPSLPSPCGAGSCLILTAKTGNNVGQQFYCCPASQGSSCGLFKWCHDQTTTAGKSANSNRSYNSLNDSSCFKCGQELSATEFSRPGTKPSTTSSTGSCYKYGKAGHWAEDCPGNSVGTWQRH